MTRRAPACNTVAGGCPPTRPSPTSTRRCASRSGASSPTSCARTPPSGRRRAGFPTRSSARWRGSYVTAVKTTAQGGHHGLSFLIVDAGEGVSASKLDKLGWHASDTATVAFQDAFVAEENLLGTEHDGFRLIMANFQWERLLMALGAVGAMDVALERTIAFTRERRAFGRPLTGHQAVRHRLVELATTAHTCRCVTYDALRRFVAGEDAVREVTMAKLATQRAAFEVMDACLQLHGGAGYMREYEIERMARDARLGPIGGGTDEVMKEILGKVMGL
jgi:acyl-CoA dehydrogenase